jgi:hypothetical protein
MNDEPERFRVRTRLPREGEWWAQAKSDFETEPENVPELACPLLGTQVHTELMSREDAVRIRDWARSLLGWDERPGLEVVRYPTPGPCRLARAVAGLAARRRVVRPHRRA